MTGPGVGAGFWANLMRVLFSAPLIFLFQRHRTGNHTEGNLEQINFTQDSSSWWVFILEERCSPLTDFGGRGKQRHHVRGSGLFSAAALNINISFHCTSCPTVLPVCNLRMGFPGNLGNNVGWSQFRELGSSAKLLPISLGYEFLKVI